MQLKIFKLAAISAITFFSLTGCGGGTDNVDSNDGGSQPSNPPSSVLPIVITNTVTGHKLAAGDQHAARITGAKGLRTWGNNQHGQLGIGKFEIGDASDLPKSIIFPNETILDVALVAPE